VTALILSGPSHWGHPGPAGLGGEGGCPGRCGSESALGTGRGLPSRGHASNGCGRSDGR